MLSIVNHQIPIPKKAKTYIPIVYLTNIVPPIHGSWNGLFYL